jgi:hemoglobin
MEEADVYQAVGEDGFRRLTAAFYRQIPGDPILGPMYPATDLAGAEERLRDFLIFRFGGPVRYLETRGHPRLRMRHNPFPITEAARNRWVEIMTRAIAEAALPFEAAAVLSEFFSNTATFLRNREA